MEYNFKEIESNWQKYWKENQLYKVEIDNTKPKYYVLDMFPYPSGAGLHVGHPLGYIASDIYSRYKRLNGFNVLHPMGYDAFGLPAEQYAIQTGQHPAITTKTNVARYREQLDKIGFSYDWDREVRTANPEYYKWTQWVFMKMFNHYFNNDTQKAESIESLVQSFENEGAANLKASCSEELSFTADDWKTKSENEKQEILLNYRLAFLADTFVNWCPKLGTVLANDEVTNGVSVRGGYPVEQKKMRQWSLRVSAYAPRLLNDMENLEWTDALKEIQKNWIGKSVGAELQFKIQNSKFKIEVFTTRPDTLYGTTFMVLAPESDYVAQLTTDDQKQEVEEYIKATKKRSERDRMSDVKTISGVFSGSYAIHPITGKEIPVWIADYVLAGYGTGAVMAVPAHDSRDFAFAKHFDLDIIQVIAKNENDVSDTANWTESYDAKEGIAVNSEMINGLSVGKASKKIITFLHEKGIGKKQVNYRLRDAIFSRQRYWGEPFPVYFKDNLPYLIDDKFLPLELPKIDKYLPTEDGKPPLARADEWAWDIANNKVVSNSLIDSKTVFSLEYSTMPGFAGSSAYYLRYMDNKNNTALVSKEANEYWQDVDLYIGGTEHATGHLIYSRFWNKFLFDLGLVSKNEPFKKLINQGMIQGRSNFVYIIRGVMMGEGDIDNIPSILVSKNLAEVQLKYIDNNKNEEALNELERENLNYLNSKLQEIKEKYKISEFFFRTGFMKPHVDISIVKNDILDTDAFRNWLPEYKSAEIITEKDGNYYCDYAVEKMSKSMYNVVNPDDIIETFGADTLRMYEMFLGPLEQAKPWDTSGIDGVYKFLRKTWNLFYNNNGELNISDEAATKDELKILHKTIKKIKEDIENFSFNTSISAFMICVNELTSLKANKRDVLEQFLVVLSPFAPHITEELWQNALKNKTSIVLSQFPEFKPEYLVEDNHKYPVQFNGKTRFMLELPINMDNKEIEKTVLENNNTQKYIDGKTVRKVIVVPKRIINIVIS